MLEKRPRIIFAGLSGDSGKTITSLSFLSHCRRKALAVSVFKKGPDYIDAAWLGHTADSDCYNLDTYLSDESKVYSSFIKHSVNTDISIIEGNRGLFDGSDVDGTHSTAGLARLLKAPVILTVDATKSTRTIAALVKGCLEFEKDVNIAGVIINKIAGERHKKVIKDSIEKYCGIPVVGAIPKLRQYKEVIPSRHLGLVTPSEYDNNDQLRTVLEKIATEYLDFDTIVDIATNAPQLDIEDITSIAPKEKSVRIGYFKDSVFTFYYPENLHALKDNGAELIEISSTNDSSLPEINALYIGGGFPETKADKISANKNLLSSVKDAVENGLPVYAECGGLIFLCRSLSWQNNTYTMSGVFPIDLIMHKKPVGHGYTRLSIDNSNPFYANTAVVKGHEFHYSGPENLPDTICTCMNVTKGKGMGNGRDGLLYKNCMAVYTHIHSDGNSGWAPRFCELASKYKNGETDFFEIDSRRALASAGA